MEGTLRKLLFAVLALGLTTALVPQAAHAKSKAACTKIVKAKEQYLTPGGRCGEDCRAAIDKCVKGQKI